MSPKSQFVTTCYQRDTNLAEPQTLPQQEQRFATGHEVWISDERNPMLAILIPLKEVPRSLKNVYSHLSVRYSYVCFCLSTNSFIHPEVCRSIHFRILQKFMLLGCNNSNWTKYRVFLIPKFHKNQPHCTYVITTDMKHLLLFPMKSRSFPILHSIAPCKRQPTPDLWFYLLDLRLRNLLWVITVFIEARH